MLSEEEAVSRGENGAGGMSVGGGGGAKFFFSGPKFPAPQGESGERLRGNTATRLGQQA